MPRLVEAAGCAVWSPYYLDVTEDALVEAHALGLRVVVWTVNEVEEMLDLARSRSRRQSLRTIRIAR